MNLDIILFRFALISLSMVRLENLHLVSVATPAEPRGEKKLYFVKILGGEKLLKFVEKCR